MDAEERLRRRRERYRLRRDRETPEDAQRRRLRNRDYMRRRRAAMTPDQRRLERTRNVPPVNTPQHSPQTPCNREVPSFNDPAIIRKMCEFHNTLLSLDSSCCSVCHERFPSISVDAMNICKRCSNDKHTPKLYSADNNMDPGPVPPELTGLTRVEEMLISPIIPMMSVYRLPHGQYGYSGHIINLPQDVSTFVNSLPRLPTDLDIIIVRKQDSVNTHRDFRVRRLKVLTALQWLVTNNIYFNNVTINPDNVSALPDDQVLSSLPTLSISNETDITVDQNVSTAVPEDPHNSHLSQSFVPFVHHTMTEQESINHALHSNSTFSWPATQQNPINEFHSEGYFSCAFPILFPTGKAEFLAPRLNAITIGNYFKHLMLYDDGRFAKHCRFRYFALNTEMRWRALQTGRVYVRQNPEDAHLSIEDLRDMVGRQGEIFANHVLHYAASLRGTKQYWFQQRSRLISMVDALGMPTIFFTHSAADLQWPELARLIGVENTERTDHNNALIENPAIADWFFYHRIQKFVDIFYVDILGASDFWLRFEWQHRGSPHVHGLAWLRNAPNVQNTIEQGDEFAKRELIDYIDKLVCTQNPGVLPDGSNLADAPTAKLDPHVCSQSYSQIEDYNSDLIDLVATCQRHTRCSTSYCLRTKQGVQACRFGYPQPLQTDTAIAHQDGTYELVTARNDTLVNSFNPLQLSSWRANVDMKYLVSKEKVVEYCAKYATKSEPRSETMQETFKLIVNSLKDSNNSLTAIQKLLINSIGERDYSSQETCHLLLQLPMFKASRDFVVLSLDGSRIVENTIQDHQVATALSIFDHYVRRPTTPAFNTITLFTFAKSYTMPKELSAHPTQRRKDVVVVVRPYCSPDPNSPAYEQYCKQKMMLHVPFRRLSDLLVDHNTFAEAYQHYLLSADIPCSLEEDIHRLQEAEPNSDDEDDGENNEEQPTAQVRNHTSRHVEEWMLICQNISQDIQPSTDPNDNVDWTLSSRLYSNLHEIPSFLAVHRQSATPVTSTTNVDPNMLQLKQLQVYNTVSQHLESNESLPLHMIVTGTAGTGKSYLINCLKLLLQDKLRIAAPTGVASYNIQGYTLHSLFNLPTKGDFKQLQGQALQTIQQSFLEVRYVIIDEMSMMGRKLFGQIDRRLRQTFPHHADCLLGGCSLIMFGDFGQLPPVMDLPLYTTMVRTDLSDLGSTTYHTFNKAIVLDQVMRQCGEDADQILFRDILLRLRNGQTTVLDWEHLMKQTPSQIEDVSSFQSALHLFPTVEAVVEYNLDKLRSINKPIAIIKAVHSGPNAHRASTDDAGGLDPVVHLANTARVMLIANLWVEAGLVNGALGTVVSICYHNSTPPDLPLAVMVRFDNYSGPTLADGTIPITPLRRTWSNAGAQSSRLQLPLKLAWAVTIHKSQGLTLDKVMIDIGRKEFCAGLTYVACSRVRRLKDLLFISPFPYERLSNISKSKRLQERLCEDERLHLLQHNLSPQSPTPSPSSPIATPSPTSLRNTPSPPSLRNTPSPPSLRNTPSPPSLRNTPSPPF